MKTRYSAAQMANRGKHSDVLEDIQQDWGFMTGDECIPVQVALQLMDTSSLGRATEYDKFRDQQRQLQKALRGIVNG